MPRASAHLTGLALGWALALLAGLFALPSAASATTSGGSSAIPVPKVKRVSCRTECAGLRAARAGSIIRVRGRDLDAADTVILLGERGDADDVELEVAEPRRRWFDVKVPRTARTGRVTVVNLDGVQAPAGKRSRIVIDPAAPEESSSLRALSAGPAVEVEMQGKRVFFDAARKAQLVYLVRGAEAATVNIELVRLADGVPIASWTQGPVPADTPQTVTWDGTAGGVVQKDGRYEFRVFSESPTGVRAQSAQAEDGDAPGAFTFLRHKFPIRGAHDYGEFAASFGGGRGHQGQDVFAKCGTPLVAARGGVVKHKATHSRAGNYVVIDGQATGTDYVYMHLRDAALVSRGDRVRTGQRIGYVGDTGRASGCHLHFELWDSPGWYTGGSPFDPLPSLKAWDAQS
jgi:murein DD-endopeptidase MepM/ murein hydrolase activator NlpD